RRISGGGPEGLLSLIFCGFFTLQEPVCAFMKSQFVSPGATAKDFPVLLKAFRVCGQRGFLFARVRRKREDQTMLTWEIMDSRHLLSNGFC
ncbi:MAG: hypothetical protein V2A74_07910, partial [bacterium]